MHVFVLGSGQDGGIPQPDCPCGNCRAAAADPAKRRLPACVAFQGASGLPFLIDATPAFPEQIARLRALAGIPPGPGRGLPLAGILLTHAHMGHYMGLVQLGREAAHTRGFPLYGTAAMRGFLAANKPFSYLFTRGEIDFRALAPGRSDALEGGLAVTAFHVPHRNEDADTVGYAVTEGGRTFVYVPDADLFPPDLVDRIRAADLALVDGTFYTHEEVMGSGREDAGLIPHPPIHQTRALLAGSRGRVTYTHLNHTNRALADPGLAHGIAASGLGLASDGDVLEA